jgi:hypothetical protein
MSIVCDTSLERELTASMTTVFATHHYFMISDMLHRTNVLESTFYIKTVLEIAFSFFFFSCHGLGFLTILTHS